MHLIISFAQFLTATQQQIAQEFAANLPILARIRWRQIIPANQHTITAVQPVQQALFAGQQRFKVRQFAAGFSDAISP